MWSVDHQWMEQKLDQHTHRCQIYSIEFQFATATPILKVFIWALVIVSSCCCSIEKKTILLACLYVCISLLISFVWCWKRQRRIQKYFCQCNFARRAGIIEIRNARQKLPTTKNGTVHSMPNKKYGYRTHRNHVTQINMFRWCFNFNCK